MNRSATILVTCAIASAARAYVNIEDFTVGAFSEVLTGEQSYSGTQLGLDTAHSAFGKRGWFLDITSNFDNVPLHLDVGNGEQKLTTTSDLLTYRMQLLLGVSGDVNIDLSRETSLFIDLYTDPPHVFADQWSVTVTDSNAVSTSNDGWLFRSSGIQFDIASFSRQIDWSRVRSIEFTEHMYVAPNPTSYSVTHLYAVPEPSFFLSALGALGLLHRRKPRYGW